LSTSFSRLHRWPGQARCRWDAFARGFHLEHCHLMNSPIIYVKTAQSLSSQTVHQASGTEPYFLAVQKSLRPRLHWSLWRGRGNNSPESNPNFISEHGIRALARFRGLVRDSFLISNITLLTQRCRTGCQTAKYGGCLLDASLRA
jgi:hypothetical protein